MVVRGRVCSSTGLLNTFSLTAVPCLMRTNHTILKQQPSFNTSRSQKNETLNKDKRHHIDVRIGKLHRDRKKSKGMDLFRAQHFASSTTSMDYNTLPPSQLPCNPLDAMCMRALPFLADANGTTSGRRTEGIIPYNLG